MMLLKSLLGLPRNRTLGSGNRPEQPCPLIRTGGVGEEIQQASRIAHRAFNQPEVTSVDRTQLFDEVLKDTRLEPDFLSHELFGSVGEFQKSELFGPYPESFAQVGAESCHLNFQDAELNIERLLDFVAF